MVLRETCAQHASTWLIKENVHIMCICLYQTMHSLDLKMVSYKAGRHRMEGKAGFSDYSSFVHLTLEQCNILYNYDIKFNKGAKTIPKKKAR